jgi:hypothetical protein
MSGPGLIRETSGVLTHAANLYNFETDRATVKPEHRTWLQNFARSHRGGTGIIWVIGTTSRSGTAGHNRSLSQRRASEVAAILRSALPPGEVGTGPGQLTIQERSIGEQLSQGGPEENSWFRSVVVMFDPQMRSNPVIPRDLLEGLPGADPAPPAESPTETDAFKVKMLGSGSATVGVDFSGALVDIEDVNGWGQVYTFAGGGGGVSPIPAGMSLEGPPHHFSIPLLATVRDFEGGARLTQITLPTLPLPGGPSSPSLYCRFSFSCSRGCDVTIYPFNTGLSIGLGTASVVFGRLTLIGRPGRHVPAWVRRHRR